MVDLDAARARAQAVLRVRGLALAVAALPAAVAVILLAGRFTGRLGAPGAADAAGWDTARWAVGAVAVLVLLLAALVGRRYARAEPPRTPVVQLSRAQAPELYQLIEDLADHLEVPAPSAIALTPDCDSWLEECPGESAPALVIGSPFLWWMRAGELRALLAPVVAGTGAAADPEIAAARRFVRSLDASLSAPGEPRRAADRVVDRVARTLLGACREHIAELERTAAGWASEHARIVDYGLRIAAQEQVGLAYAGWDRLLSRVAQPAWRLGRLPTHLNAGVVSALTELSRRDRLAGDYETRLGDRPACDLLEEPGTVDAAVSLLAAELFHGAPEGGWRELDWADYPAEVVDHGWRRQAAALQTALDGTAEPARNHAGPTLDRVLARLAGGGGESLAAALIARAMRASDGQPPRSGRDLLVEHVTSTVCCAAVDTAGAAPGLDWLDGPVLLVGGPRGLRRASELPAEVAQAVEQGKDSPLRGWLGSVGVRLERPVRL